MAFTFQGVTSDDVKKKKVVKQEKKAEKKKVFETKKKQVRDLTGWRETEVYETISRTIGFTSLIVLIAAIISWIVFFWFAKTNQSEGILAVLKVAVQVYGGIGIIFAGFQFINCIFIALDRALPESNVYNWGTFVISAIAPILCFVIKYDWATLTLMESISKCLTLMSLVTVGLIPVCVVMFFWWESNSIESAQDDIDISSKVTLIILFAFFGALGIFNCVFTSWLKSPIADKVALSYNSFWSLSLCSLITVAFIIWSMVFNMIEDLEFSVGYTIATILMLAMPMVAYILVFALPQAKIISLYIMESIFSIVAAPASIALCVWTGFKFF